MSRSFAPPFGSMKPSQIEAFERKHLTESFQVDGTGEDHSHVRSGLFAIGRTGYYVRLYSMQEKIDGKDQERYFASLYKMGEDASLQDVTLDPNWQSFHYRGKDIPKLAGPIEVMNFFRYLAAQSTTENADIKPDDVFDFRPVQVQDHLERAAKAQPLVPPASAGRTSRKGVLRWLRFRKSRAPEVT